MYGIGSPFSVTGGYSLYSWFHGVMSVIVDYFVEIFSLFLWIHVSSMYIYSCRCVMAILGSGSCEKTVMSSVRVYECQGVLVGGCRACEG